MRTKATAKARYTMVTAVIYKVYVRGDKASTLIKEYKKAIRFAKSCEFTGQTNVKVIELSEYFTQVTDGRKTVVIEEMLVF